MEIQAPEINPWRSLQLKLNIIQHRLERQRSSSDIRRTLVIIQLEARMFLEVLLQATLHDGVLPYVMVLPMHKNAPTAQQYKRCQI